jgi:hypothetical protein
MSEPLLALVQALDGIYEQVVADPAGVREGDLVSSAGEALSVMEPPVDRRIAREVRRVVRLARRLAEFWSEPDRAERMPADWRSAVDEALGSRGWQPTLEIVRLGLDGDPSPELFEETRYRFAIVHFRPWMEDVTYEEYLESREP